MKARQIRRMRESHGLRHARFFRAMDQIDRRVKSDAHMPWNVRLIERRPAPFHKGGRKK